MPTSFPMALPHWPTGTQTQATMDTAIVTPLNDLAAATVGATFSSYTPALQAATTNPTLGTGSSVFGHYFQLGKFVFVAVTISFGTSGTNAGSGNYSITLPVTPANPTNGRLVLGHGRIQSAAQSKIATAQITSAGTMTLRAEGSGSPLSNTVPGAWTAGDFLDFLFTYEAA